MNRIYQGKVSKVEKLKPGKKGKSPDDWEELKNWPSALWRHHELFQDAVNYYIVALGALANPLHADDNRVIRDLPTRLEEAWERFPRQPVPPDAKSLRDSVAPWMGLNKNATLKNAFDMIHQESSADSKTKCLALLSLLTDLGGEGKIQQGGRQYFPYFCVSGFKGNFPRGNVNLVKKEGKRILPNLLWGADPQSVKSLTDLHNKMRFEYFAKPSLEAKPLSVEESKKRLKDAVDHLCVQKKLDTSEKWKGKIDGLKNVQIPAYEGGSINKPALKVRFFAWMIFNYVEQTETTFRTLRAEFKKPKEDRKGSIKRESESGTLGNLTSLGDDPIKLSRGKHGYVFRAFTALSAWGPRSDGEPVWSEFDIAAFKEALKALNQFNRKTNDREEEQQKIEMRISWMTQETAQWEEKTDLESENERYPPKLAGDKRYDLARKLEKELSQTVLMGKESFHITRASLRGLNDLTERWNRLLSSTKKRSDRYPEDQLVKIVKDYQSEDKHRRDIGSVPLFLSLTQEEYCPLWRDGDETEDAKHQNKHFASNMLFAVADLHMFEADLERKKQPIKLTPAEPKYSRRLFSFSDLMTDKQQKSDLPEAMNQGYCDVPLITETGNRLTEGKMRLHFTAPRLHRDELLGGSQSRWLQPMMAALGIKDDVVKASFDKFALNLMPDIVKNTGESHSRYLLNFSTTIKESNIADTLDLSIHWKYQLNGTRGKSIHLHWPETMDAKNTSTKWWTNKKFVENGFTVLANDLGQRTAGAWALLHVTSGKPNTQKPIHFVGMAGQHNWYATILETGVYRLPGENECDHRNDRRYPTQRGRKASTAEYRQAIDLAESFGIDGSDDAPKGWIGETQDKLTYSEQNDQLIKLANRRLSRLSTYHRWSCFDPYKIEDANRRGKTIDNLRVELEGYPDHADLLTLVQNGKHEDFRKSSGIYFTKMRCGLESLLVTLANRSVPMRNRSWAWVSRKNGTPYGDMLDCGKAHDSKPKIMLQRGLSLRRIEQLENLRKLFLRYNRAMDRQPGEVAAFGRDDKGRASGEPCQLLLDKISRMKEERINLTAHAIIAKALGVRLREEKKITNQAEIDRRDLHGEYERIPERSPVDMIVLEDLESYRLSHDRGPGENKKLMNWAHRSVLLKLKELAEPFGMPILEIPAAYSSKFDARSGMPGFRAYETHGPDDNRLNVFKKALAKDAEGNRNEHLRELIAQFEAVGQINIARASNNKPLYTLIAPQRGGPLFVPIKSGSPVHADMNASVNIGLRAIAAPETFHVHRRIRTIKKSDDSSIQWLPRATKTQEANKREQAAFRLKPAVTMQDDPSKKLKESSAPNFFYDPDRIGAFDKGKIPLGNGDEIAVCSGIGLWKFVKDHELCRCVEINKKKFEKWNLPENVK